MPAGTAGAEGRSGPWGRTIRALDGLALGLVALTLVVIVTGGVGVGGRLRLGRAEDVVVATMVVVAIRHLLGPYAIWPARPRRLVVLGVALYTGLMSFITITRHWNLRTHAVDLALYDQMVWAIANRGAPWSTLPDLHGWGDHFTIILYLMAPLYWVVPSVLVMLVVQCLALALGALAVWGLGRHRLGDDRVAAVLAVLFLVNPSLHGINLRDFHPQALAIPLLLAALYALETGRWPLYWAALLLTLACREDASLPVIGLGAWAVAVRRRPWTGGATVVMGLTWLFLTTRWLVPHFRGETYSHLSRWGHLGGSVDEIVLGILANPGEVLGTLFTLSRLRYLAAMLAPWAFLPLLALPALLPTLPTLAANLLSTDPVTFHHRTQYSGYLLPFLALAAIAGAGRLGARKGQPAVGLALGLALIVSVALTARTVNDLMVSRWWPDARTRAVHALVARVPPGVVVGADERVVPHLAHRPRVYIFPQRLDLCEWLLIETGPGSEYAFRDHRLERRGPSVAVVARRDGAEEVFTLVAERGTLLLLSRGPR